MPVTIDGTSGVNTPSLTTSGSTVPVNGLYLPTTNTLGLATNSVERVRIDASGNLGIGTTSPAQALHVVSTGNQIKYPLRLQNDGTSGITLGAGLQLNVYNGTSVANLGAIIGTGSTWSYGTYSANQVSISGVGSGGVRVAAASAPITFHTGNADSDLSTERMRLESSGNLGIGVVPSGWGSAWRAIQLGTQAAWYTNNDFSRLSLNVYGDSVYTERYLQTDHASQYIQASGNHTFMGADSGTAGNAITWTTMLNFKKDNTVALQGANFVAGTGITFPATQSASTDANTLDDYEEGSWTPNQGAGLTVSGSFQSVGTYIKIGRLVVVRGSVGASTSVSISPNGAICSNLPFSNGGSSSGNSYEFGTGSSVQRNSLATGGQVAADQNTTLYSTSTYTAVTAISFVCTYITA